MTRRQVILLVALFALAAILIGLALRNPAPPWMPEDAEHRKTFDADACLECHGPGGPSAQSASHPVGRDCTRCHAYR